MLQQDGDGASELRLDGLAQAADSLLLVDDGRLHRVQLTLRKRSAPASAADGRASSLAGFDDAAK